MSVFDKTVRNIKNIARIREVISILIKYGFGDIITSTALRRLVPRQAKLQVEDKTVLEYHKVQRIRKVVEELGTTSIKLAQFLSNRPDLISAELIEEFEKLQSEVPPLKYEAVEALLEKEFGKPIDKIFTFFDKEVLGSASIGQVHRAILYTGEDVVVKIQRTEVRRTVEADLDILQFFVERAETYIKTHFGILNPSEVIDTFKKTMYDELNYKTEVKNMLTFRRIYENDPNFYAPKPYAELSTEKVLVSEFISGCKITDVGQLIAWGHEPERIAEKGMEIYLKQIFEQGFFHADPHPGNIIIRPNGKIVLIDFGMVGKLMKTQKYAFAGVFIALANQDPKGMASNLRKLAVENNIENIQIFENDVAALIEEFLIYGSEDDGMTEFAEHLQVLIQKYQLQVSGTIFLILRSLAILEGIGRVLHPKFDILAFIKPYGLKILTDQFSFSNQRNEIGYSLSQAISLLYIFPIEIKYILKRIRSGDFAFRLELVGQAEILKRLDRIANRFILAILTSALLITGAISLSTSGSFSKVWALPLPSFLSFSFAVVLSLWLLFGKRKKK